LDSEKFRVFILSLISILGNEIKEKRLNEFIQIKFEEKIFSFILFLSEESEEEFSLYIPVFFKILFYDKNYRKNKKTLPVLFWICFLFNSINFKILFRFDFLSFDFLFFVLFLNMYKSSKEKKIKIFHKIVSVMENIYFEKKNCLATKLINSLKFDIKKKIFVFFFFKTFCIRNNIKYTFS
jgi:hypothetical protein